MKVYISIVSHGHEEIIKSLSTVKKLSNDYIVVIKSNTPSDDFTSYIDENTHWLDNKDSYGLGFGANNNYVYNYCKKLSMNDDDIFIVLNPDVNIKNSMVVRLIEEMVEYNSSLSAINLYLDEANTKYDNSIREFPTFVNFVKSFIGFGNDSVIDKNKITTTSKVDWAAGSFLAFKSKHYGEIGGFDESYYMYCEDIDICYRSKLLGKSVLYHPDVVATHFAGHKNRNILSKHFLWHLKSTMRFLMRKKIALNTKSSLL
ncbi:glycosyltransferase family 2 protein [Vibrio nomapromontoriensis]